jgi:hypothetical protein
MISVEQVFELDHLLLPSSGQNIKSYQGKDAMDERISEWMDTPQGTLADRPSWGSNLGAYKFEPQSVDLAVSIEMAIVRKLPRDIENLDIRGIGVSFPLIDLMTITILSQIGLFAANVKMGDE